MNILRVLNFFLLSFVCLLCISSPSFAVSVFPTTFTYYAEKQDLSLVLTQFARTQNYSASLSSEVKGEMSGRFENFDPNEFLDGIRSAFGVRWYRLGNILYFYNESETIRTFITPRAMTAKRMFDMLKDSGVFSDELIPRMSNDIITVSGPQAYINQISTTATSFEHAQTTNYVMKVFPLKFAWADDITVTSLDQSITVPGIATILRSMVLGVMASPSTVVQHESSVAGLKGTGLVAQGKQQPAPAAAQNQAQTTSAVNIMADSRVNSVVINDAAYRMPYYEKVIADLDKPVELVEIHAAIVDVDSNFKRDLGVTFQGKYQDGNISGGGDVGGGGDFNPLPEFGKPTPGLALSTIYTHGFDQFLARVEALESDGEARVLGRPSVLTVDNVQASLENTSTFYIEVGGQDEVDLFKVEAGTILRVTPHIIRDENNNVSIKLAVHVQDNQNDQSSSSNPNIGALPPIRQTKINTQAIVGEGQSLLIGGYYYEQKGENESGLPIFKNIPIIGHLFKTQTKQTKRMERLILITPRVISHNNLPALPTHLDEPTFHRSPTQNTYESRTPEPSGGGCTRKKTPVQNPQLENIKN